MTRKTEPQPPPPSDREPGTRPDGEAMPPAAIDPGAHDDSGAPPKKREEAQPNKDATGF